MRVKTPPWSTITFRILVIHVHAYQIICRQFVVLSSRLIYDDFLLYFRIHFLWYGSQHPHEKNSSPGTYTMYTDSIFSHVNTVRLLQYITLTLYIIVFFQHSYQSYIFHPPLHDIICDCRI